MNENITLKGASFDTDTYSLLVTVLNAGPLLVNFYIVCCKISHEHQI